MHEKVNIKISECCRAYTHYDEIIVNGHTSIIMFRGGNGARPQEFRGLAPLPPLNIIIAVYPFVNILEANKVLIMKHPPFLIPNLCLIFAKSWRLSCL